MQLVSWILYFQICYGFFSSSNDVSQILDESVHWVLSYPLSAQRRLIRLGGCPADPSLRWAHTHFVVGFVMKRLILSPPLTRDKNPCISRVGKPETHIFISFALYKICGTSIQLRQTQTISSQGNENQNFNTVKFSNAALPLCTISFFYMFNYY